MAAEKLTKGRLIQISILLTVLIGAFFWGMDRNKQKQTHNQTLSQCELSIYRCENKENNNSYPVTISNNYPRYNQEISIQLPVETDQAPTAILSGITMNMGSIPLVFKKEDNQWVSAFKVPSCMHETMKWGIEMKYNQNTLFATFIAKK